MVTSQNYSALVGYLARNLTGNPWWSIPVWLKEVLCTLNLAFLLGLWARVKIRDAIESRSLQRAATS
jgi:hypothetical protein